MEPRSLRQRKPVDYSLNIKDSDRWHFVRKKKRKTKSAPKVNYNEDVDDMKSKDTMQIESSKNKENIQTVFNGEPNKTGNGQKGSGKKQKTISNADIDEDETTSESEMPKRKRKSKAKASKTSTKETKLQAKLEKVKKDAYDRLFERYQQLRNENKLLLQKQPTDAPVDAKEAYIEELERKLEVLMLQNEKSMERARTLQTKVEEEKKKAKKALQSVLQKEAKSNAVIDAYKMITSTRVVCKEEGLLECRTVSRETNKLLDYTLKIGDEEIEFHPSLRCIEEFPEVLRDEITFDLDQLTKFMQLILKHVAEGPSAD